MPATPALETRDPFRGPLEVESSSANTLAAGLAGLGFEAIINAATPLTSEGLVTGTHFADIGLAYLSLPSGVAISVAPTTELVVWVSPQRPVHVTMAGTTDLLACGFVCDRSGPTAIASDSQIDLVLLSTSRDSLRRHVRNVLSDGAPDSFEVWSGASVNPGFGMVDAAWHYAASALNATGDIPPFSARALEHLTLSALIQEVPSNLDPMLLGVQRRPASVRVHASRAADWVADRLDRPVAITEWASAIGVSPRYLQRIFREVHGVTPHQYLLKLRLERARALMYTGRADSVTDVANQTGFAHLGRFAATYKETFGEYPSEAIRQRGTR